MLKLGFNKWLVLLTIFLIFGSGFFYLLKRGEKVIEVMPEENKEVKEMFGEEGRSKEALNRSSLSGLSCKNYNRRPIAVILAEDPETRPLSGISQADLVIEMPVITGSITRMMAIFQCESPQEIGSIRSARHDFIPLAMGFDAILVHWGGSHYALDKLKKKIMDNIDALANPYNSFWREKNIPPPHNGFSSMDNLLKAAKKLGYRLESNFQGYQHLEMTNDKIKNLNKKGILEINYPFPYNIRYEYNPETNSYLRWRGGEAEIDRLTGKQVEARKVIIMRAFSRQIEGEYNDLDIEGEGRAIIYQGGEEIQGSWRKDKLNPSSKIYFFDETGKEIEFYPGKTWIEIVEPYQKVSYE